MFVIILSSFLTLHSAVTAIPLQLIPPPAGFEIYTDKVVLKSGILPTTTTDSLCQQYHREWWKEYSTERDRLRQQAEPDTKFGTEYTRYPSSARPHLDVPVEGIMGEPFPPWNNGWRTGLWGCYTVCQDLRKTIEWAITYYIESMRRGSHAGIQVRARWVLAYECPHGMIARQTFKDSLREAETEEEINDAIAYLYLITNGYGGYPADELSLLGQTGVVSGCHCVHPADENERMKALIEARRLNNWSPTVTNPFKLGAKRQIETRLMVHNAKYKRQRSASRHSQDVGQSSSSTAHILVPDRAHPNTRSRSDAGLTSTFQAGQIPETLNIEDLDQVEGDILCNDIDYPVANIALTATQAAIPDAQGPDQITNLLDFYLTTLANTRDSSLG